MIFRAGSGVGIGKTVITVALLACSLASRPAHADWNNVSPADLKEHLGNLQSIVEACRAARNTSACDPSLVGSDDRLQFNSGSASQTREIRYDWLRDLLDRAGKKESAKPQPPPSSPILPQLSVVHRKPPTVDQMLATAIDRLKQDQTEVDALAASSQQATNIAAEQKKLSEILSRRQYQGVRRNPVTNRFWEWLDNLINRVLGSLAGFGGHARWLPWVLFGLFIGAVLIGLIWSFIQIERRSRIRLIPESDGLAGAPSAREWQLWLKDAQDAAAAGRWREAIHFLYWAAISRLESKRLWPADRARTPREYLRLLPESDSRRLNLTALTRSFERTWYGGREAASSDYETARSIAAGLGVE